MNGRVVWWRYEKTMRVMLGVEEGVVAYNRTLISYFCTDHLLSTLFGQLVSQSQPKTLL